MDEYVGTFGLADALIKLGITYGSEESLNIINLIYKEIATNAIEQSLALAKEYGAYPKCEKDKLVQSSFIQALNLPQAVLDDIQKYGLYNSQLLTCAPTGSTATMLQTSTGVESVFALSYTRKTQSLNGEDTYYSVDTKIVDDYKTATGDVKLPDYFITSADINPIDRIKVQSVLQKYTDASISSTINLPNKATIEDVYDIYINAWKEGLKGVTVYRSGCKREGVLVVDKKDSENKVLQNSDQLKRGEIIKAGDNCIGLKRTLMTGCGTLHVEAFFDPQTGALMETYLSKGSTGGCQSYMVGLSRMMSLAARGGVSIDKIIDQLGSCVACPSYAVRRATHKDTSKGSCCPVAVGNALNDMHAEILERIQKCIPVNAESQSIEVMTDKKQSTDELDECPECHAKTLIHEGGCISCTSCGFSKCG